MSASILLFLYSVQTVFSHTLHKDQSEYDFSIRHMPLPDAVEIRHVKW